MIELIFSITIMGLVLMTAPMLMQRSMASSFVTFQQESIAAAATQISVIMTAKWDHADTNASIGEPVLHTASGAANVPPLISNCVTDTPAGVSSASGRYCKDALDTNTHFYNASPIALDSGYADIDDFDGVSATVLLYNNETYETYEGDYIDKNITVTSRIFYGDDIPRKVDNSPSGGYKQKTTFANPFRNTSATTTNIKLIEVVLTSTNTVAELSDKQITLSAFMCNIGAPKQLIRKVAP